MRIALLLAGYGNVAQRFVQLLDESKRDLGGTEPVVVGYVTRSHGSAFDAKGLEMGGRAFRPGESGGPKGPHSEVPTSVFISRCLDALKNADFDAAVLIETTTLNIDAGEPSISHVRAAIAGGAHVITANKGPVAFAYRELAREAAAAGVSFLFEGAVMDGIPVFNLVRETMPAVRIRGYRGVVNTTTNYLLAALERGEPFEAALERMQDAGVAEADPSLDVDGWDAAAKTAALANVWLDADLTPHQISREGISAATGQRARDAVARGHRLKLVASGGGTGPTAWGRVELLELPATDPLGILEEHANAIELDTWPLGRVVITQRDGGLEKTAYALLSDLVKVASARD